MFELADNSNQISYFVIDNVIKDLTDTCGDYRNNGAIRKTKCNRYWGTYSDSQIINYKSSDSQYTMDTRIMHKQGHYH